MVKRKTKKEKAVKIKKQKQKKEPREKTPTMRSAAPGRFGAWCLIAFMLFTMAFGIYKILRAPTEDSVTASINSQVTAFDRDTVARTKAVAFAERFAIAYLSYDGKEDYSSKMKGFFAGGQYVTSPLAESKVDYAGTTGIRIDGNDVDVDVICRVVYSADNGYTLTQFATIRVPVRMDKNGNCAVAALPVYVNSPNNAGSIETVKGSITASDMNDELRTTVRQFFDAYYGGTASELAYYVTGNYGEPTALGLGDITVSDVNARAEKNGDKWNVECDITINNNGISQMNHCFLEVVKGSEGRYYINRMYTM